jgi:fucose 4-O-acetylase-like acetyltransferase
MDSFLSQKFKFFSFLSMALLVFVHGYDLNNRFLLPTTLVNEPLTVTTFIQYLLANGLFRFRIPILFMISGYLFALRDEVPYAVRAKKRARTLLVPYLLWSAIGILLTFVFEQWSVTRQAVEQADLSPFLRKNILDYSIGDLMLRWIMAPIPFQLWFIRCLFVYNLMYPLLKQAITRFSKATLSIVFVLWLGSFGAWIIESEGLLFFTLGIWIAKTGYDIQQPKKWLPIGVVAGFWIGTSVVKTGLAFYGDAHAGYLMPTLYFLHKFVVASGMVAMWFGFDGVVRFFMNQRWFVWLTAFSFIIYAFHVPLVNYALSLAFTYGNVIPHFRLVLFILLPTLVIGMCVMIGSLLRKIVPRFYGVLTGGRGLV